MDYHGDFMKVFVAIPLIWAGIVFVWWLIDEVAESYKSPFRKRLDRLERDALEESFDELFPGSYPDRTRRRR